MLNDSFLWKAAFVIPVDSTEESSLQTKSWHTNGCNVQTVMKDKRASNTLVQVYFFLVSCVYL